MHGCLYEVANRRFATKAGESARKHRSSIEMLSISSADLAVARQADAVASH